MRTFSTTKNHNFGTKDAAASAAHAIRGNPVILDEAAVTAAAAAAAAPPPAQPAAQVTTHHVPAVGMDGGVAEGRQRASDLIRDASYRGLVEVAIIGCEEPSALGIDRQAELADAVTALLDQRLDMHILKRVEEKNRGNFSIGFTRWLIPHVAAMAVMYGHVKEDMSCISFGDAMLKPQTSCFVRIDGTEGVGVGEGCYLYYDMLNGVWIRSGKVCGKNRYFLVRHGEHEENSKEPGSNAFYLRNPSYGIDEVKYSQGLKKCSFENLVQFVGLGFMRSNQAATDAICDTSENGLFHWSAQVLKGMQPKGFYGSEGLKEKQLHMVSYLFELVYDLMLSDKDNISESPGFECCGLRSF